MGLQLWVIYPSRNVLAQSYQQKALGQRAKCCAECV